jgi:polyferredoxin
MYLLVIFCYISLALLFLDFTGTVHSYLGWVAKIQFAPSIFAGHFVISLCIVFATLLLGRIYCSTICPLGVCQDMASYAASLRKKARFSYRKPRKQLIILRYALLVAFFLGTGSGIVSVFEPYSAFGRMVSQILGPIYKSANNLLAYFAERIDSYAFYTVDIWIKSAGALAVAILTFAVITVFAYKSGRGYCNTLCPVGSLLSLFARFSLFKVRIDMSKCKHCDLCAKNCKSSCINTSNGKIDYLRCVVCLDCTKACPSKAISYAPPPKATRAQKEEALSHSGEERRKLLKGSALAVLGCAVNLQAAGGEGGLAQLKDKEAPNRITPIVPPGSGSIFNFHKHCTSCQLCASVCPNQVLSNKTFGFMKPNVSYERGYCRPECTKCSEVCPTGAIRPISRVEKSATQIGCAVWKSSVCIVNTDRAACDSCSRHCPTGAITMIPQNADNPNSLKIPMIDINRCIGCGACEHLCPARPHSAIYVEGIETHRTI